ncbi:hypothetical protein CLOACE_16680 [Clostridium acetireducens DSM 10703]|jgi:hypothetical protein|uniref:Metal-binding protein n=1 Tax=Clostridium acetireducens DSM 10703 TaxID=1121290 RepID=A0A1E8EXI9_9CLOT|nr:metal-binding protein [Clostridium acetireducens]OFI05510.1 hypothetical protein CLOACE_16680 [Clostridium acetireducens DSM 10703]
MNIRDIMKYIESEYSVINDTPCEICGGNYIADCLEIDIINGFPYDVCTCVCENCGYEKTFTFSAPFIDENHFKKTKKTMN